MAIKHFRYFLEGRCFKVFTDHKPLIFSLDRKSDPWSPRQQRQLSLISEFNCSIHHIAGKNNQVADALSRSPEIRSISIGVDFEALAKMQNKEEIRKELLNTSLKLEDVPLQGTKTTVLCDTSTGRIRPIVPPNWRKYIFDIVHNLHHPAWRQPPRW